MSNIEAQQAQFEMQELLATLAGVDRKLRSKIVWVVRQNKSRAALTSKESFELWKAAYLAQKPGAFRVLERARTLMPSNDIPGF